MYVCVCGMRYGDTRGGEGWVDVGFVGIVACCVVDVVGAGCMDYAVVRCAGC